MAVVGSEIGMLMVGQLRVFVGLAMMVVFSACILPLQRLFALTGDRHYASISLVWANGCLSLLSWAFGTKCSIDLGNLPDLHRESCIIVANHQSSFDPLMVRGWLALGSMLWVVRSGLEKGIPILSYDIRHRGHFVLRHNDTEGNTKGLTAFMHRALREKTSVAIFPEGRKDRQLYQQLGAFHRNGLRALLSAAPHVKVVPVVIDGGNVFLIRGFHPAPRGATIRFRVLEPIQRTDDVEQTIDACENAIRLALGASPLQTRVTAAPGSG